jgi:hypothetical protein
VPIPKFWAWTLGTVLVVMMVLVPAVRYRELYRYAKRLRPVTEGKVYRSGCLTADGLRAAIQKDKIKLVINLQDEAPDPDLLNHYFTLRTTPESEVCREMGVNFRFLHVELVNGKEFPQNQPPTIETFCKLMDDPDNYPVLIHCKAGLHRTGVLVALYRQEYEGWSKEDALRELKNHGFGEFVSSAANPYIVQYVLGYQPRNRQESGIRNQEPEIRGQETGVRSQGSGIRNQESDIIRLNTILNTGRLYPLTPVP